MQRQNISSGTPWEERYGYSRAVRVDNRVLIAGTIAIDSDGELIHPEDAAKQTHFILNRMESALKEAGAELSDVVSLRTYITNMDHSDAVGLAFKQRFEDTGPASTMIVVAGLFANALVEIEAEAVLQS